MKRKQKNVLYLNWLIFHRSSSAAKSVATIPSGARLKVSITTRRRGSKIELHFLRRNVSKKDICAIHLKKLDLLTVLGSKMSFGGLYCCYSLIVARVR